MALEAVVAPRDSEGLVWVVGNLTTDLILRGVSALPAWGREVAGTGHRSVAAGQAAYLACGLGRLSVATRLVGVVGGDPEGAAIVAELDAAGVDTGAIDVSATDSTALTVAIVRADGERAFVSDFACQRLLDYPRIMRHWPGLAFGRALCLVGLFNLPELNLDAALQLFTRAREANVVTVLDTGWDPADWPRATIEGMELLLSETDIFLPNCDEAEAITGRKDPEAAAIALEDLGVGTVIVKCGELGAIGCENGKTERVPAFQVPVHDAVGAGDSFDAGFLAARFQERWDLRTCMEFASATAATHVSRSTDRYPTVEDVRELLGRSSNGAGVA